MALDLNLPKMKHHYPMPRKVIPEDENNDQLEETLIGMEYDVESEEEPRVSSGRRRVEIPPA